MKKQKHMHTLTPIINSKSRLLILGSFPSVKSRANTFYYMHPQNRFWPLLEKIYQDNFVKASIHEKVCLLKKYHIALYDVIESCVIQGSSDSSIESVQAADIQSLIKGTQVKAIYLNGRLAEKLFHENIQGLRSIAYYLPSTSPANARYSLEDLYNKWKIIKDD